MTLWWPPNSSPKTAPKFMTHDFVFGLQRLPCSLRVLHILSGLVAGNPGEPSTGFLQPRTSRSLPSLSPLLCLLLITSLSARRTEFALSPATTTVCLQSSFPTERERQGFVVCVCVCVFRKAWLALTLTVKNLQNYTGSQPELPNCSTKCSCLSAYEREMT